LDNNSVVHPVAVYFLEKTGRRFMIFSHEDCQAAYTGGHGEKQKNKFSNYVCGHPVRLFVWIAYLAKYFHPCTREQRMADRSSSFAARDSSLADTLKCNSMIINKISQMFVSKHFLRCSLVLEVFWLVRKLREAGVKKFGCNTLPR
jgi:hypothetical protein